MAKRKRPSAAKRREHWFNLGEAAFAAFAPNEPRGYVCPICTWGFTRPALAEDPPLLTFEHVPPESYGGKELLLTCVECNTRSGEVTDHHVAKAARWRDTAGINSPVIRGRVTLPGTDAVVAVNMTHSAGKGVTIAVVGKASNPAHQATFYQTFQRFQESPADAEAPTFQAEFRGATHSPRLAPVAMLKAAYLVLFAWLGYRHIARRELTIVREQLMDPAKELIKDFCLYQPNEPRNTRRIVMVREPQWLRSFAIQMGEYKVFLPRAGDPDLYARLTERADRLDGASERLEIQGSIPPWPTSPTFSMDFRPDLVGVEAPDRTKHDF
jgi:hypothetical protein